jgi:hypothetical protein
VDVGRVAGRDIVVITNDPSFTFVGAIYVIDVTDPAKPELLSVLPTSLLGALGEEDTGNGHIANCIRECEFLWTTGTSEGLTVYDLRDPEEPKFAGRVAMPVPASRAGEPAEEGGFTHDVFVDRTGIAWVTGEDGTFGFRTDDPVHPQLFYRSDEAVTNTGNAGPSPDPGSANGSPLDFLHHNSLRTSIQLAQPPEPASHGDPGAPLELRPRSARVRTRCNRIRSHSRRATCVSREARRVSRGCVRRSTRASLSACRRRAAALRRYARELQRKRVSTTLGGSGDVLAVTEEDYLRPGCSGQGSLQTWQITGERNSDGSAKLKLLDLWTTELNELREMRGRSDEVVPATVNCSAHWFDEANGLLAQAWYDQGIRFLDISDPRDIKQVGYYVTPGEFWAAYYAPGDPSRQIVYALDTLGGIDVLRIDRSASARAVEAPVDDAEVARRSRSRPSPVFGLACPIPSSAAVLP